MYNPFFGFNQRPVQRSIPIHIPVQQSQFQSNIQPASRPPIRTPDPILKEVMDSLFIHNVKMKVIFAIESHNYFEQASEYHNRVHVHHWYKDDWTNDHTFPLNCKTPEEQSIFLDWIHDILLYSPNITHVNFKIGLNFSKLRFHSHMTRICTVIQQSKWIEFIEYEFSDWMFDQCYSDQYTVHDSLKSITYYFCEMIKSQNHVTECKLHFDAYDCIGGFKLDLTETFQNIIQALNTNTSVVTLRINTNTNIDPLLVYIANNTTLTGFSFLDNSRNPNHSKMCDILIQNQTLTKIIFFSETRFQSTMFRSALEQNIGLESIFLYNTQSASEIVMGLYQHQTCKTIKVSDRHKEEIFSDTKDVVKHLFPGVAMNIQNISPSNDTMDFVLLNTPKTKTRLYQNRILESFIINGTRVTLHDSKQLRKKIASFLLACQEHMNTNQFTSIFTDSFVYSMLQFL
jgi:hypothetical protein